MWWPASLPNCTETLLTIFGGAIAGIINPINPLLEPEQIAAILRETKAKVVVDAEGLPENPMWPQKTAEAVRHAPGVATVLEIDLNRYLTPPKSLIVPLIRPKKPGQPPCRCAGFQQDGQEIPDYAFVC